MKNAEIQEYIDYAKSHEESAAVTRPDIALQAALVVLLGELLLSSTEEEEDEKTEKRGLFGRKKK